MTAHGEAPVRPGIIPPDWTGGRLVREAVLAATGDGDFAAWAAVRWPHGNVSMHGAREDYQRHLTETGIRRDGVRLSAQEVRVIVSLLAAEGIRQSGSGEVVVRECGKRLTSLAARLKILADSGRGTAGFRLARGDA